MSNNYYTFITQTTYSAFRVASVIYFVDTVAEQKFNNENTQHMSYRDFKNQYLVAFNLFKYLILFGML